MGKLRVDSPYSSEPQQPDELTTQEQGGLAAQVRILTSERDALRAELEALRDSAGADGPGGARRAGELEAQVRQLRRQQEKHEAEKEELERKRTEDLSALWDEHWRRVAEIEKLRGDQDTYSDHLREVLREMERENVELRGKAHSRERLAREVQQLEEQMQSLAADVEANDREMEEKNRLIAELRAKLLDDGASAGGRDVSRKLRDAQQAVRQGQAEIEELRARLESGEGEGTWRRKATELEVRLAEEQRRCAALERELQGAPSDKELVSTQRQLIHERDEQIAALRVEVTQCRDSVATMEDVRQLQEQLLRSKQEKLDYLTQLVDELRSQRAILGSNASVRSASAAGAYEEERWERGSQGSLSGRGYRARASARDGGYSSAGERLGTYRRREEGPYDTEGSRRRFERADTSGYSSGASPTRRRYSNTADPPPPWSAAALERARGERGSLSGRSWAGGSERDAGQRSGSIVDRQARTPVRRREWEGLADSHQPSEVGSVQRGAPAATPARGGYEALPRRLDMPSPGHPDARSDERASEPSGAGSPSRWRPAPADAPRGPPPPGPRRGSGDGEGGGRALGGGGRRPLAVGPRVQPAAGRRTSQDSAAARPASARDRPPTAALSAGATTSARARARHGPPA
eukprot:TRINITY_DN6345_c0_g1_i1.p1 TRINITY_DN6345_c0_g1~~TRINITY_DN6345_c0_g1_i1.p1  ORF type:complete len:669 (+),score=231.53 TRINITY_DN6345_c0_g1_i1:91-2007(+)